MRDSYSNHSFMCAIIPSSVVLLMHVFLDFLDFLVKSVRDSQSTKQADFERFFRRFYPFQLKTTLFSISSEQRRFLQSLI